MLVNKVSKGAKIRNRYNQVPDTNGKVTNSQLDTTNDIKHKNPDLNFSLK